MHAADPPPSTGALDPESSTGPPEPPGNPERSTGDPEPLGGPAPPGDPAAAGEPELPADGPDPAPRSREPGAAARPGRARQVIEPWVPGSWSETVRARVTWGPVVVLAVWLAVRVAGVGAGTVVETSLVLTPYVALASVGAVATAALLRVWTATAAAGACCVGYLLVLAPLFVAGPRPAAAPQGPEVSVMTVNVQFGWADPEAVVRLVEDHDVALLGVQELTPAFHRALVAEGFEDLLPHGVVDARGGASGTGLYTRHPVERVAHHVPGRHEHPTGLVAVEGAPPVQVTVVHPVPPVGGPGRAEWRSTLDALPRPDDGGTVHMVIGDFNATVDQPTMRALLDDGYVDAAGATGRGWVATWRFPFTPPLTIDHVLVDRDTAVEAVSVHSIPGSDHRAVVATVRLPEG
jgi:endonuclease/exonuclease/phosphatase family metal-dependent hydrolase